MRRVASVILSCSAILTMLSTAPTRAAGPDPHTQPLYDGCQRSNAMILSLTTAEWVYVNKAAVLSARASGDATAGRRSIEGVVNDFHPAGDDLFVNHDFNDVDISVTPDPGYTDLPPEGDPNMTLEWEEALTPVWAWPQIGDRIKASGSYIWDCGHWGNGPADDTHGVSQLLPYDPVETGKDIVSPGAIRGEGTELHPLYEMASFRKDAAGILNGMPSVLEKLDAWISSDGGWALAEEECALMGVVPLAGHTCSRYRDVGGAYSYTIKLGPRPDGASIAFNEPVVHSESSVSVPVQVVPDEPAGEVRVSFTLPHTADPQRFGVTVEAGWTNQPPPVHHLVTIDSLHILKSLDGAPPEGSEPSQNPVLNGPEQTPGPGEWVMWLQVNGIWAQMPGITQVTDGMTVTPDLTFDFWLPAGVPVRLFVSARECDIPLVDCSQSHFGGTPGTVPFVEVGYNDHPGRIRAGTQTQLSNEGIVMVPGTFVYKPFPNANQTDSSGGNEWNSDYTCGLASCYELTATLD